MICTAHKIFVRIKSRRIKWTGHVARKVRVAYRVLAGRPGERDHLEDTDVDGRIILRWIFRKLDGVYGLDGVA